MKKKLFFLLPLSLIAIAILFWHAFFGFFLTQTLNQYTLSRFGVPLHVERVVKEGNSWIFKSLSLKRHDVGVTAEQLQVSLDWNLFKRSLSIEVHVKGPEITMGENAADLAAFLSNILPKNPPYWILTMRTCCEIDQGRASWIAEGGQRESADFDLTVFGDNQKQQLQLAVWMDEKARGKNGFSLHAANEPGKGMFTELTFEKLECKKIARGLETAGYSLKGWEIDKGVIDGAVEVCWPKSEAPYAVGKARIRDLAFEQVEKKISAELKEGIFDLHMEQLKGEAPSLDGKVELLKGASVAFYKQGEPFWKIEQLSGGVYFLPDRMAMIDMEGECSHNQCGFHLTVDGKAQLLDKQKAALELSARLFSDNKKETVLRFAAEQIGPQKHQAKLAFENVGPDEFAFVQEIFFRYALDWNAFHVYRGGMNASGVASMIGWQLTDLDIQKIEVKSLEFDVDSLDLSASFGNVAGNFSINLLEEDPLKTINANFHVSDGRLISRNFSGNLCCLNNVKTQLTVHQGVVQESEIQGEFAGFKGTLAIDWMARDKVILLEFSGPSEKLAPFLPSHLRASFLRVFFSDDLEIRAGVAWNSGRLGVEGVARLAEQEAAFGFQLEKSSEKFWKSWPADEVAASYWEHVGKEVMLSVLPPIASPAVIFEANWIKSETGIAGLVLREGWFKVDDLDLKRFAAPFLFPDQKIELSGTGSFKGGFDQNFLSIEYVVDQLVVENRFFAIKADHVGRDGKETPVYYVNFKEGAHFGSIPIVNAAYIEKNTGLTFFPTNAHAILEGENVHLTRVVTECMGIQMGGGIDLDFCAPDGSISGLEIQVNRAKAGLKNVQVFLARFYPELWLLKLPMDGQLGVDEEGAFFKFSFFPEDFSLEALVKGRVAGGSLSADPKGKTGLRDLQMQFMYNHKNRYFEIKQLQADIHWESAHSGYQLYGDHIRFEDLEKAESVFDFWVGDKTRDLVRFVGKIEKVLDRDGSASIEIAIDPYFTHVGTIHPSNFLMRLNDRREINKFQIGVQVELDSFLSDLRLISHSGLGSVLGRFKKEVQAIGNAAGTLDVQVNFDQVLQQIAYRIKGEDLEVDQFKADSLQLTGTNIDNHWIVEAFQWNEKSASGEFIPKGEGWKVKNFKFTDSDIASFSLDGMLYLDQKKLEGRIEEISLDLSQISGIREIESFIVENDPHGRLTGSGNISFEWGLKQIPWRMEAILDIGLANWDAKGICFEDACNISCHFISDQGATARKLRTKVLDPETRAALAQVEVEKIEYNFSNRGVLFDELKFEAPAHHLPRFTARLAQSFPQFVTPGVEEAIRNSKLEGAFKGVVHYEMEPPYEAMRLKLEDGIYHFLNTSHELTQCVMNYDPFEFSFVSGYRIAGRDVWLYGRSSSPSLSQGELTLAAQPPDQNIGPLGAKEALNFDWENDAETGISFSKIQGFYQGLKIQLAKDPVLPPSKKALHLVGSVGIQGQKVKAFFPEEIAETLTSLGVGDGYQLQGKWHFLKNHAESYEDKLHFTGLLKGERFQLKGYRFDTLEARLDYSPRAVRINNLVVKDRCGSLFSDRIDLLKTNLGAWAFAMPLMKVRGFRPSLLQEEGMPRPKVAKPMVIQELTLAHTQGSLSDSSTIIGRGSFHFRNRSKKLLQNTIFQIPSDLLSRIGLDPAVLTPVSGDVHYEVRDGKIYLTKFKDIYSDAKLSKFYLASSPLSTVDFEGGLNVHVKMKQYNLIFKLAELFTFKIQGNLGKPAYSIQKHQGSSSRYAQTPKS